MWPWATYKAKFAAQPRSQIPASFWMKTFFPGHPPLLVYPQHAQAVAFPQAEPWPSELGLQNLGLVSPAEQNGTGEPASLSLHEPKASWSSEGNLDSCRLPLTSPAQAGPAKQCLVRPAPQLCGPQSLLPSPTPTPFSSPGVS